MLLALSFFVRFQNSLSALCRRARRDDRGQATAEYALVLLGAAAVAILVIGWAAKTGKVGELLDSVFNTVTGKIN